MKIGVVFLLAHACSMSLCLEAEVRADTNEPAPAAAPSPVLDENFILLPAYDWEPAAAGKLKVGDEIELKISSPKIESFEHPLRTLHLEAPPGTEDLQKQGFELDPESAESEKNEPNFRTQVILMKGGQLTLPSLAFKDSNGKSIARTNPLNLDVASAIRKDDPKPDQSEPAKPPARLSFPLWFMIVLGLIALALVAGLVYLIWRWVDKRSSRERKSIQKAEIPKPEDEIALAALSELEINAHYKRGDFKKHYFGISEILKNYLGARYRFDAAESTTREMLAFMEEQMRVSDTVLDQLESLFSKLDRVKFTDHVPPLDEAKSVLEDAKGLVLTTRRIPQAAGAPVHAT